MEEKNKGDRERIFRHFLQSRKVSTDTRKIAAGSLFFALKGAHFNGNYFAGEALQSGCSLVIVDEDTGLTDSRIIQVADSLRALQELAHDYRNTFSIPFLAITGSNGKTTTKELVRDVLAKKFKVHATAGNLNNHIGIPLTLLSMPEDTEFAVIEMGANHPGEIASYCCFTRPDYGLITNIGKAHLEGFGGYEGVKRGKKELYDYLQATGGIIFANIELDEIREITKGMQSVIAFGLHTGDVKLDVVKAESTLCFSIQSEGCSFPEVSTQLAGTFNLFNIAAALAVGKYFGITDEASIAAIKAYTPDNNRSQLIHTVRNTLILDAYNANPTSLGYALDHFAGQHTKDKFFIIGDMLELGEAGLEEHKKILQRAEAHQLEGITVGKIFKSLEMEFPFLSFLTVAEAHRYLKEKKPTGQLILLKGSRGIALEALKDTL